MKNRHSLLSIVLPAMALGMLRVTDDSPAATAASTPGDQSGEQPQQPPVMIERATVGRRVWFWCGNDRRHVPLNVKDPAQAFYAGVLFVHKDGRVNLEVTDHTGEKKAIHGVVLANYSGDEAHGRSEDGYATWMKYRMEQKKPA